MKVLCNISPLLSAEGDARDYSSRIFDFSTAASESDEYQLIQIKDYEYKSDDFQIGRLLGGDKEILVIRQIPVQDGDDDAASSVPEVKYGERCIGPFCCEGGRHLQPGKTWVLKACVDSSCDSLPDATFAHCINSNDEVMNMFFAPYTPPPATTSSGSNAKKPLDDLHFGKMGILIDVKTGLDVWIADLQKTKGVLEDVRKIADLRQGAKARYEISESRAGVHSWRKLSYKELLQLVQARYDRDIHDDFANHSIRYPQLMSLPPSAFRRPRKRKRTTPAATKQTAEPIQTEAGTGEQETGEGEEEEEEEDDEEGSEDSDDDEYADK